MSDKQIFIRILIPDCAVRYSDPNSWLEWIKNLPVWSNKDIIKKTDQEWVSWEISQLHLDLSVLCNAVFHNLLELEENQKLKVNKSAQIFEENYLFN